MLTNDQKKSRIDISKYLLTQDETWIHHFDPEAKGQKMKWKYPGSQTPKKFKRISSAGKVLTLG